MSEAKRYVHKPEKMQKISRFYGPNSERQYVRAEDYDAAKQRSLDLSELIYDMQCDLPTGMAMFSADVATRIDTLLSKQAE